VTGLHENILRVRERIDRAARRAGRRAEEITLVAVTKTVPAQRVTEAIREGLTVLGENRVQEAREKIPRIPLSAEWHLVGHLQSNKAAAAAELFSMIHSVDSGSLARRLDRACEAADRRLEVLLQVNVSGEQAKSGLRPDELHAALEEAASCARLRLAGLMTIPPLAEDPEESRPHFARLKGLLEEAHGWLPAGPVREAMHHLSMGMTDDFEVAIEEGATLVRVGRAIFGERQEP
jgi:pyridoxal phosphate enzyme (YggS family)